MFGGKKKSETTGDYLTGHFKDKQNKTATSSQPGVNGGEGQDIRQKEKRRQKKQQSKDLEKLLMKADGDNLC